jgi:hypothetical protein
VLAEREAPEQPPLLVSAARVSGCRFVVELTVQPAST